MSDTPNSDKLEALVNSGALDYEPKPVYCPHCKKLITKEQI